MVSRKKQDAMDGLSKEDLRSEILLGRKSRFSQNIPYLQQRLALLEDEKTAEERDEDVAIAREANTISAKAYRLSKWAIAISAIALLYAVFGPD